MDASAYAFVHGIRGHAGDARGLHRPPLAVGDLHDVLRILMRNALVLALHAMACVAGFIAGSSLPLRAHQRTGLTWTLCRG